MIGVVVFLLISVVLVMCIILKCSLSHARMKENKFRMNEFMAEIALKDKLYQANGQGICLCSIIELVQVVLVVSVQIDVRV